MVFESLVADLLNRFLGDYVENLKADQLKLGIFGGDVELANLDIKSSALDALDLPVKLKFGFLAKLVLKIPWKNLYTEPVIATIDGLHLLVVPNQGVKYNAEKETKQQQDTKQSELAKLEDARKERRKRKEQKKAESEEPPDSFAEKMVTQVIKNLQVTVKNIHVRYEDRFANAARPFAAGVTLDSLYFQTTDSNYKPMIIKEAVKLIYKLVDLNSLSVYWDSGTKLIGDMPDRAALKKAMVDRIARDSKLPSGVTYILKPITIAARLRLNPKPESDGTNFTTPKVLLDVGVKQIGVGLTKFQYQDLLQFCEAQERFTVSARYRKYRPDVPGFKGYSKKWWHFAYTCILEEQIRRRKRNWSWERMRKHRQLVRDYQQAWKEKLTSKHPSKETLDLIERAEKELDVFNLNVARQQADSEVDRLGLTRAEDIQEGWVSWASSKIWGPSSPGDKAAGKQGTADEIANKFDAAMTPEEKAKLFDAIDYQENAPPTAYPKEFEENVIHFKMEALSIGVADDVSPGSRTNVMTVCLSAIGLDLKQRPSARAVWLQTSVQTVAVNGLQPNDAKLQAPVLVQVGSGGAKQSAPFISAEVETNPLSGDFDQSVRARLQPLFVVYHAATINRLVDVFKPPESVRLNQITAAAMAKYEDVKAQSTTGLAHAVEHRSVLVLDIKVDPTLIIVPYGGLFTRNAALLVADLGKFSLKTVDGKSALDPSLERKPKDPKFAEVFDKAYDKFKIELNSIQMLYASAGEDWQAARKKNDTPLHVLRPIGVQIALHKASVDDVRIPKMRVLGTLPDIALGFSDRRLLELAELGLSIPTPPPAPMDEVDGIEQTLGRAQPSLAERAKMRAIMEVNEMEESSSEEESTDEADGTSKSALKEQQVQMELAFVLNKVLNSAHAPMRQPGSEHGTGATGPLKMVASPERHKNGKPLLMVEFVQANRESPFFASDYHMIEQKLTVSFEGLHVGLHREALMELQKFGDRLQARLALVQSAAATMPAAVQSPTSGAGSSSRKGSVSSAAGRSMASVQAALGSRRRSQTPKGRRQRRAASKARERAQQYPDEQVIKTKVIANMGDVSVIIGSKEAIASTLTVEGVSADVVMRAKQMDVTAALSVVSIIDKTPPAKHAQILSVCGTGDVLSVKFTQFNRTDDEKKKMAPTDVDMAVKLRLNEMRFVFLNAWLNRMLCWAHPFQAAATEAAVQAAAAAQEQATAAAQQIQAAPPKVSLDVDLNAPIVLVPQSQSLSEALYLDLGRLTLVNGFASTRAKNSSASMTIETLKLSLTEMKLARALLGADGSIKTECRIIEPMTFSINVRRNISFATCSEQPELAVEGRLPKVVVGLTQEDYGMMMKLLSGNLTEGTPPPPQPPVARPRPARSVSRAASRAGSVGRSPSTAGSPASKNLAVTTKAQTHTTSPSSKAVSQKISFDFNIEGLSAALYNGSSNLMGSSGVVARQPQSSFAQLEVLCVRAAGHINDDESMAVRAGLDDFRMEDQRGGAKTKIKRLLDKRPGNQDKKLVDVKVAKNKKLHMDVDLAVCPVYLCLCPEFLGSLAKFFTIHKTEEELELEQEKLLAQAQKGSPETPTTIAPVPDSEAVTVEVVEPTTETAPQGTMSVRVRVADPEIILVEDASKPDDTLALILRLAVELDLESGGPEKGDKLSAAVRDLQIFSSYYMESKRDSWMMHVLKPVDIIAASTTTATEGQSVDVEITPIVVKVSPAVVRLLSTVAAEMSAAQQLEENAKQDEITQKSQRAVRQRKGVWDARRLKQGDYWFLRDVVPEGEDAAAAAAAVTAQAAQIDEGEPVPPSKQQRLTLGLRSLAVRVEAGVGHRTVPMVVLNAALNASVQNWATRMAADATLDLQMQYFNEHLTAWEPLIEPVERDGVPGPWQLHVHVQQNTDLDNSDDMSTRPPKMAATIGATDVLQLTVTKSCLDMVDKLSKAFAAAAHRQHAPQTKAIVGQAPFVVRNDTGMPIEIVPTDTLEFADTIAAGATSPKSRQSVLLHAVGAYVEMDWRPGAHRSVATSHSESAPASTTSELVAGKEIDAQLMLRLPELQTVRTVRVGRAETRSYALPCKAMASGEPWQLVVRVTADYGRKLITLCSQLCVVNHTETPIDLYSLVDTNLELCGTVDASGGDPLYLPLPALYSANQEYFFRPTGDRRYETSDDSVRWHDCRDNAAGDASVLLRCAETTDNDKAFYVKASTSMEKTLSENTGKHTLGSVAYTVHLRPPVIVHNALPCPVSVSQPHGAAIKLEGGAETALYSVCPGKSTVGLDVDDTASGGGAWRGQYKVEIEPQELSAVPFKGVNDPATIDLGVHASESRGQLDLSIYCPFWMVNQTGLDLRYKVAGAGGPRGGGGCCGSMCSDAAVHENAETDAVFEQPAGHEGPLLFTFRGKDFFSNKKAQLQVSVSEWSDPFPVDVVGSTGRISAKAADGQMYECAVRIQLANSGLTKICTFTPYYLVDNKSRSPLEVAEAGGKNTQFVPVPAKQCVGFWPRLPAKEAERRLMVAKYPDKNEFTMPFPFTETFDAFARIQNDYTGVYITCAVSETAVVVSLEDYASGMAPALIINHTPRPVVFSQADVTSADQTLPPHHVQLFTWDSLTTAKRELQWACDNATGFKNGLYKDDLADFRPTKNVQFFWTSFLSGRQRVLLFTDDLAAATKARQLYEVEPIDQQVTLSLHGIGLSLVNNVLGAEVCYVAITSSGIVWEEMKRRYKGLSNANNEVMEAAFVAFNTDKDAGNTPLNPAKVNKMEVDFERMRIVKPGKERRIRRSFQTGVWVQYKTSLHQVQLHFKLNHMQVDNQLRGCVFPVVFAPVPPPKSVAAEAAPKPFTEVSLVMKQAEHKGAVPQIKYACVLVQEFAVRADIGFVNAMIALFAAEGEQPVYGPALFEADMDMTRVGLDSLAMSASSVQQKMFFDSLHLSPLKIHLSFSQGGSAGEESGPPGQIHSEFLNLFMKSVGLTLTEFSDVVLKLAYFEREHVFLTQTQLVAAMTDHYSKQAIKQFYVLVLGLDIIGNPFGLVRDLTSGVEDLFYEPIQGAIQGPGEFAEGLALGVRSLFGHTVGGAASAVGRITGTVGKGLAALTMDDEYQKRRQEALNRRPAANVTEGLAQGGRGLVMGVYDGVTGVFTKPWEGARQEGAKGFVKGVGKGLVGAVARPATGVVDCATSTIDAVRKVADTSKEVKPVRPPRYIHPDRIVRPYQLADAEGNKILSEAAKGVYAETDWYIAHAAVKNDNKEFLFATDQRLLFVSRNCSFGTWDVSWQIPYDELADKPQLESNGKDIKMMYKHKHKRYLGLSSSKGKTVHFENADVAKWMEEKVHYAYARFVDE